MPGDCHSGAADGIITIDRMSLRFSGAGGGIDAGSFRLESWLGGGTADAACRMPPVAETMGHPGTPVQFDIDGGHRFSVAQYGQQEQLFTRCEHDAATFFACHVVAPQGWTALQYRVVL